MKTNRCIKCVRHKSIKHEQIMGDLPSARSNPTRPFYHTGVDYTKFNEVTSNKRRGITTTKGYFAVFARLACILLLSLISSAQCEHINNSQGVNFDKISDMHLIHDQWKLVVYYDMEPYWKGQKLLNIYLNTLGNMCFKAANKLHCDLVLRRLRDGFLQLKNYDGMMLGQQLTRSTRQRRGLDRIGYVANSSFGVLDEHFAEHYEKQINMIKKNQTHLGLLWKNQTSIVEAEHNLLKGVEDAINKHYKILSQQISLETASNILTKEIVDIEYSSEFMTFASTILVNLTSIQTTFLDIIGDIHHGKFNIDLLAAQLRSELDIISGQLPQDLSLPIDNIQMNLQDIYPLLTIKARMTANYLIFEFKIPLAENEKRDVLADRITTHDVLQFVFYILLSVAILLAIKYIWHRLRFCCTAQPPLGSLSVQ